VKLASLAGGRDGRLAVVSRDLQRATPADAIAPTLQAALDDWPAAEPWLTEIADALEANRIAHLPFDEEKCASPLPRAFNWCDASAYVNHVSLVRKARGAELPASFWTDPLMYRGGADTFIGPRDPIRLADAAWGIDFESEVAVIVGDVPMGVKREKAGEHIRLLMLVNDVTLRNAVPVELAKGFGFFQSKAWTAFSPIAATPDELGPAWDGRKVRLPLVVHVNGELLGEPNAGDDMAFDFPRLVAHAARTRPLGAGTIIGSGTVSNKDARRGVCCLAEKRALETIKSGKASTPFLKFGDRVKIEMHAGGHSIFGAIEQQVVRYAPRG